MIKQVVTSLDGRLQGLLPRQEVAARSTAEKSKAVGRAPRSAPLKAAFRASGGQLKASGMPSNRVTTSATRCGVGRRDYKVGPHGPCLIGEQPHRRQIWQRRDVRSTWATPPAAGPDNRLAGLCQGLAASSQNPEVPAPLPDGGNEFGTADQQVFTVVDDQEDRLRRQLGY